LRARLLGGRVVPIFVRLWAEDERIYGPGGVPERGYRPDPESRAALLAVADAGEGRVFEEEQLGRALTAIQAVLGEGPTGLRGEELQSRELAPYALAAAFAPLLFLIWRRNV
ncbi:MAG: hypothetical protein ACRDNX_12325, partial [Gaiellaceae bacterium]